MLAIQLELTQVCKNLMKLLIAEMAERVGSPVKPAILDLTILTHGFIIFSVMSAIIAASIFNVD